MNKNKLLTISVGIAAFNEEQNIENILMSIIKQDKITYILEKIIVISDASTDRTETIVKKLIKNYPFITLIADGKRKGQPKRLLQLYKMNSSDFIFTFDGDVVLAQKTVIEKMLKCFLDPQVVLVGGNKQPIKAKTFVEKLINTWFSVWYEARKNFNQGNSIYNIGGCSIAMRRKFAKTVKLTAGITSTVKFLYFSALQKGYTFHFAKDAVIYYRSPNTLQDYLLQTKRAPFEQKKIAEYFGNWIFKSYSIPTKYKIAALIKMFIREPLFTPLAGIFMLWVSKIPPRQKSPFEKKSTGAWKTVQSTKNGIDVNY